MVPELPPAPAALVLAGRAFLTVSLWSAAARRRIADLGPPGGEDARSREEDLPAVVVEGESGGEAEEGSSAYDVRVSSDPFHWAADCAKGRCQQRAQNTLNIP